MTASVRSETGTKMLPKLELLRFMTLSREGDRREAILKRQSKGWFHIAGMGHEGIAALAFHMQPDDYLFPHYRDRALVLARGTTNYDLALAFFGKAESGSGGRQMPGHHSDRKHNIFSMPSPVAANQLPSVGTAWAMQLDGKKSITIASIGDASIREGEFYEAVSFAIERKLPSLFLVQDNRYGISTNTDNMNPLRLGVFGDQHVLHLDGRNVNEVYEKSGLAVVKARSGGGPTILWIEVDRLESHSSSDDQRVYRPTEDIEAMMARDPLRHLVDELIASGELTNERWEAMQTEIRTEVDADYQRAEKAKDPDGKQYLVQLYGDAIKAEAPPIEAGKTTTMVKAIGETLMQALASDSHRVMFGEDVEDPKGGVFGFTKGCTDACPKQVFNSPLAEATIAGVAVGMAAYGWKPIFEIQFIDFMPPAWNQFITNIATLRWRTMGDWTCPMVIYAPYGAYLPGGSMWHSQSNDGILAKLHGINIVIPSTPEDAAGLFWTAIHGNDPTLILVPKHIFRKQMQMPAKLEAVPLGKARTVREGKDVTVVTWGNCVEICEEAAEKSQAQLEIIDLRSLVPCDWAAIETSVAKTGRLVVVHEDSRTCGFGATILAEMTSNPDRWNLFLSPPQLVARADTHIGYNPAFEYACLPDVDKVLDAIRVTLE